jgi:hypothetical protein
MAIVKYITIKLCTMKSNIKILYRTTMMLLILILPAWMYGAVTPILAQSDGGSSDGGSSDGGSSDGGSSDGGSSDGGSDSSASQDYQEFQACLSDAEVGGSVSEQQIRDCFAPIYNTGTAATGPAPSDSSSANDGDNSGVDDEDEADN